MYCSPSGITIFKVLLFKIQCKYIILNYVCVCVCVCVFFSLNDTKAFVLFKGLWVSELQ